MIISNEFTIPRPVDEAWHILTDIEGIAPCMPGAQLKEVEGDTYRGLVKVKIGPITAKFSGQADFVERDDTNYRAVVEARGKEATGKGMASATVTAQLTEQGPDTTRVNVEADLTISGKIAQFGRSAVTDVSTKLIGQFTERLEDKLQEEGTAEPEPAGGSAEEGAEGSAEAEGAAEAASVAEPEPDTASATDTGAAESAAKAPDPAAAPDAKVAPATAGGTGADTAAAPVAQETQETQATTRRVIDSPEPEAVDILRTTGGATMAKLLIPVVVVIAIVVIVAVALFG
ncbi:MAG: SRPBCC family protein [Nocardiopsaceae bacterium]|nr:SRPBCC family protein [Nocardiopsaceae bacterium]